jgi:hypothetical protein
MAHVCAVSRRRRRSGCGTTLPESEQSRSVIKGKGFKKASKGPEIGGPLVSKLSVRSKLKIRDSQHRNIENDVSKVRSRIVNEVLTFFDATRRHYGP